MSVFIPPSQTGITIYTKSNCIYCDKVKEILDGLIVSCDSYLEHDREEFLSTMKKQIGKEYKTFPMVFMDGTFIGGYEDTLRYLEHKRLFMEEF